MTPTGPQPPAPGARLARRLRHFHATTLSGLYRWPREHYRVLVGRSDASRLRPIASPRWSYFADPFLWCAAGRLWLFAEQFLYLENRARLVALPLDDELRPIAAPTPLALSTTGHASFPCLFAHENARFLLPETSAAGTVDLYRCEEFPHRWRRERSLLVNIDAADTVPLLHHGRWWLFTSLRRSSSDGGHRSLAIFFSDDLRSGRWQAHPINADHRYIDSPFSWGRNAGPILSAAGGTLLRPYQHNVRHYGEAIGWMRIETLTTTEYCERPLVGEPPFAANTRGLSPHHLSTCGEFFACDVRDRSGCFSRFRPFRSAVFRGCPTSGETVL